MSGLKEIFIRRSIIIAILSLRFAYCAVCNGQNPANSSAIRKDTFYIHLPDRYDTLNVSHIGRDITRMIFDGRLLKDYRAPQGMTLDVQRKPSFAYAKSKTQSSSKTRIIDISIVSDSLRTGNGMFFKRHQFFVIYFRDDSLFFHKARGEYLTKVQ